MNMNKIMDVYVHILYYKYNNNLHHVINHHNTSYNYAITQFYTRFYISNDE